MSLSEQSTVLTKAVLHLAPNIWLMFNLPVMLLPVLLWCCAVHLSVCCVQACGKHGIAPGVFCLGEQRARALAAQGYQYVAYDTDLNLIISSISGTQGSLKA